MPVMPQVIKAPGQRDRRQHQRDGQPGRPHASRVPISPRGRKNRISTINRERQQRADPRHRHGQHLGQQGVARHRQPQRPQQVADRVIHHNREGLDQPHDDGGDKASRQRAQPAKHDNHEHDRTHRVGHPRLRRLVVAADHPRQPRQHAASGEHRGEHHRHVVPQCAHHARMRQRRLDDQPDACLLQQQPRPQQHAAGHQQHEPAIRRKIRPIDREQREIQQRRHPVRHRQHAPSHLHQPLDDEHQPEGEQQLGDVAVLMHPPQAPDFDRRANQAAQHRRDDQSGKEADNLADLIR